MVEAAVHAPGLLGRHVREGALERVRSVRALGLVREAGRDAEADEGDVHRFAIDDEVVRAHVLVDEPVAVHRGERVCRRRGDAEGGVEVERAGLEQLGERDAAEAVDGERRPRESGDAPRREEGRGVIELGEDGALVP